MKRSWRFRAMVATVILLDVAWVVTLFLPARGGGEILEALEDMEPSPEIVDAVIWEPARQRAREAFLEGAAECLQKGDAFVLEGRDDEAHLEYQIALQSLGMGGAPVEERLPLCLRVGSLLLIQSEEELARTYFQFVEKELDGLSSKETGLRRWCDVGTALLENQAVSIGTTSPAVDEDDMAVYWIERLAEDRSSERDPE